MAKARAKGRAKTTRRKSTGKDAIALLKADHRQVEQWFEQFEKARDDDRKQDLAAKICGALKVHTTHRGRDLLPGVHRGHRGRGSASRGHRRT